MALDVADGTITITTGVVGTTFTVSGLSFQPKAVILFWGGRATAGAAEESHRFGAGFFTGTTSRRCATTQSQHAAANAATDQALYDDACVATITTAGGVDGKADVDAITSDGFRLIVDDQFGTALMVGWLAIGGADLTDVAVTTITSPGAAGNQDVNVGLDLATSSADDKAVIFVGIWHNAINSIINWSNFAIGVAAGNTPANAVLAGGSEDGVTTTATGSYCLSGECLAHVNPSSGAGDPIVMRASLTTWLSTGFRLNWAEVDVAVGMFGALVLRGGRYEVGNSLTSTGVSNQVEATTYTPKALLAISHNKAQSTSDAIQVQDERCIGVATGSTSRRTAFILDKNSVGTSDVGSAFDEAEMYGNLSTAAAIVVEGLADLVSFDTSPVGFTFVMDDADPVASFFPYLLFADTPAADMFVTLIDEDGVA